MINFDKFYKSNDPCFDFLIDVSSSKEIDQVMKKLNFSSQVHKDAKIYYNKLVLPLHVGDTLFSGYTYTKDNVLRGPICYKECAILDTGEYYTVKIDREGFIIQNDIFGRSPIYYCQSLISNRLQLIYLALKSRAALDFNKSYICSIFSVSNCFCQQMTTYDTVIKGVSKLKQREFLIVKENKIYAITDTKKDFQFQEKSVDAYYYYLHRAADEISHSLNSILNSSDNTFMALTGGKDSRVLYAALTAMDRINDVRIITNDIGYDRAIATGLVAKFGGNFDFPQEENLLLGNFNINLEKYYSHYFFSKINIPEIYVKDVLPMSDNSISLIGGYCGEAYYDFYKKIGICSDKNRFDKSDVFSFFQKSEFLNQDFLDEYLQQLSKTFQDLTGETWSQKLISHYLEFRNTFHFGARINKANQIDFAPLVSRNLMLASRCLPDVIRDSARISFDLTKIFNEEIAYCQYEIPIVDFSKIPYHKRSKYDGLVLPIVPKLDLIKNRTPLFSNIRKIDIYKEKIKILNNLLTLNKTLGLDDSLNSEKNIKRIEYLLSKRSQNIDKYITALYLSIFFKCNRA